MSEAVSLFRKIPILCKFAESKRIFCLRIGEILLNMQATWQESAVGWCLNFYRAILQKGIKSLYTECSRRVFVDASSTTRCNFCKTHGLTNAVRFSLSGYREESWMTNVPLVRSSLPCCFASIGSTWKEHHYLSRATPHL